MSRRNVSWMCVVLGALLMALSIPVQYVNRTVLDAPTFADRVDQLRQRDDVSQALGRDLSGDIIARSPDLVALAPLLEQVATGVIASDALSGPVRLAAAQFNRALTTGDSEQLVLRLADAGSVVAAAVAVIAPERAPNASNVGVTLAEIGSQGFASDMIGVADKVDTMAWLLPMLMFVALVAAVLLEPDRWAAIRRVGWAAVLVAASLAALLVVAGAEVRSRPSDARSEAIVAAVWDVFVRPIWWPLGLVAGIGALLGTLGSARLAEWRVGDVAGRFRARPMTSTGVAWSGVASIALGVAFVLEPRGMVTLLAVALGVVLLIAGVRALSGLAADARPAAVASGRAERVPLLAVAAAAVLALVTLTAWAARPPEGDVAGAVGDAVAGEGEVCNGHAELCGKTFEEVSYAATHNAMSVAGKPGWFLGEQGLDIVGQLDFGVRALLVDVWYGVAAGDGLVRTSARSYEEALAIAEVELGADIVAAALRVFDALAPGDVEGEEALYMCHGLCETGATSFDDTLGDIRAWLATHPDEVLTIFIEDHVDADDVADSVIDAELVDYLYQPVVGEAFPTLGDMIRSGRRLVVMLEAGDGRPQYPWLVNGFDFVQETPYDFATVESFSCAPNRGRDDAPLFQINHWLAGFTDLVSSAQLVNTTEVLGARVEQCRDERGLQPTFVAVNYADIGDVVAVVDGLNDVE